MSRWGSNKNIVVPLDSTKDNTNRPTVTRSLGTMGKWGKMGFTSTRTYTMSALPAAVAAAAAAVAAASPQESPASHKDDRDDLSVSTPEPPKPRKFFKSRNNTPPEVIAQIIQHIPRQVTSPLRDSSTMPPLPSVLSPPTREPIKIKLAKSSPAERKKKTPKKSVKKAVAENFEMEVDAADQTSDQTKSVEPKSTKKKKPEKELKPEAPPSRILGRARKAVNYCEEDFEERTPTPIKDIIVPKSKKVDKVVGAQETPPPTPAHKTDDVYESCDTPEPHTLPPPAAPQHVPPAPMVVASMHPQQIIVNNSAASKTPEHPPIVLRISKGTSRLVSTDSEEQQPNASSATPPSESAPLIETQLSSLCLGKSRQASLEDSTPPATISTPKIIVKPLKPPSPSTATVANQHQAEYLQESEEVDEEDDEEEEEEEEEEAEPEPEPEPPEINYCTVKISPDKPPKERLKLIIKTDVIRNALAAAAAAAAKAKAKKEDSLSRKEGKTKKSKKRKHLKHTSVEQLQQPQTQVVVSEFKTPSPHLGLGAHESQQPSLPPPANAIPLSHSHASARTVISPAALSERDFDSQSSVLGSISSKGNSTPLALQPPVEESCVLHSRGSSVITSDLETSQHSSLVAPPSDIELRLESMMMDGESSQQQRIPVALVEAEPLQEDILAVLRGDETTAMDTGVEPSEQTPCKENGLESVNAIQNTKDVDVKANVNASNKRSTRARAKVTNNEPVQELDIPRTRTRKPVAGAQPLALLEETSATNKRSTRRGKKVEDTNLTTSMDAPSAVVGLEETSPNKSEEENNPVPPVVTTRRGRIPRNAKLHNNLNNNNINKIAADLTAKINNQHKDPHKEKLSPPETATTTASVPSAPSVVAQKSYGRKRKNQQKATQPSQETVEDEYCSEPTPAKQVNLDLPCINDSASDTQIQPTQPSSENRLTPSLDLQDPNSVDSFTANQDDNPAESPPLRDYKVKDKFKRTLTLDSQVNNTVVVKQTDASSSAANSNEPSPQVEPVKLVISKKKGSIFKSRVPSEQTEQASKRHLYKHRWDASANGDGNSEDNASLNQTPEQTKNSNSTVDAIYNDFNSDETRSSPVPPLKMTRVIKPNPQAVPGASSCLDDPNIDTITSVKIDRKAKDYYTVVRNVKTAHQIQEIGEYQEMDDDVEYILDALQPHNPMSTRCLSALQLATKCTVPAFRMHVRAHGVVTKFFKALSDANRDLSLGLCTTAIMYILSQEGLNMDLDQDSLELMMNLLESEQTVAAPADHANYERNKQRVRELCEEIKVQGKATHLNVDTITVGTLAMETLLSLTSKRAGDWFKEELRRLGGLEHIIKTINDCCRPVIDNIYSETGINWTRPLLDNMQTVERCLRVLENVTQLNEENQQYILTYNNGSAATTLCSLYSLCDRELIMYPTSEFTSRDNPGIVIRELLIPLMKVLISLTHPFSPAKARGAELVGSKSEVIETSFHLLLKAPNYIPDRCVFELSILSLLLLNNLTMYTPLNRERIMKANAPSDFNLNHHEDSQQRESAISAVMTYFYKCEELARLVEKNTDAFLDKQEKAKKKQEEVDETVNNLLQKAGHHMEHSLKGSYTAILIGHLITDNEEYEAIVRKHVLGNGFKEIISVLEKYYNFMNLTASAEASVVAHIKSTNKLLDYFKKRDLIHEMNANDDAALPLNLELQQDQQQDDDEANTSGNCTLTTSASATSTSSVQRVYKTYSQR